MDLLAELSRRVAHLEERLGALQDAETTHERPGEVGAARRRRNRRKFGELLREYEVPFPACSVRGAAGCTARRLPSRTTRRSSTEDLQARAGKSREARVKGVGDTILPLVGNLNF